MFDHANIFWLIYLVNFSLYGIIHTRTLHAHIYTLSTKIKPRGMKVRKVRSCIVFGLDENFVSRLDTHSNFACFLR